MKYSLRIFSVLIAIILTLTGCVVYPDTAENVALESEFAEVSEENLSDASKAPVESTVEEILSESSKSEERIYSINDFLDLPIGRSSIIDLIDKNMEIASYSEKTPRPLGDFVYITADPDVTIHLSHELEYGALFYLSYENMDLSTYNREVNLQGTYVDVKGLGIYEKKREDLDTLVIDRAYTLRDFVWLKLGETTFEELCTYTPTEDYFYFDSNEKIFYYPADVQGAYFYIYSNSDGVVYRLVNSWDSEKDPEVGLFFDAAYEERLMNVLMTYIEESGID